MELSEICFDKTSKKNQTCQHSFIQQKKQMGVVVTHVQDKLSTALQEQLRVVLWIVKDVLSSLKAILQ